MESKLPDWLKFVGVMSIIITYVFSFVLIWVNEWWVVKCILSSLFVFIGLYVTDKALMSIDEEE